MDPPMKETLRALFTCPLFFVLSNYNRGYKYYIALCTCKYKKDTHVVLSECECSS